MDSEVLSAIASLKSNKKYHTLAKLMLEIEDRDTNTNYIIVKIVDVIKNKGIVNVPGLQKFLEEDRETNA
jgi:hypothetical protein